MSAAPRPILLNPGPVTLTDRVRAALAGPDLCHREPEFADLQDTIRRRLLGVYELDAQDWAPVMLSGSGTAAVEAMIATLPGEHARLLIVDNGVYGARMAAMAAIHGIDHEVLSLEWGASVEARALERALAARPVSHVAVVHHETTTGRLNELDAVAACCRRHGAELLVDAVSSFGAEAIDFAALPIAACAATANKCLHGAPGVAFVIVRRRALAHARPRALYLDLVNACEKQDAHSTAFTPAVPAFNALAEALAEHREAGGWPARRARYRTLAEQLAKGLQALGVAPLLPAGASSCVLRGYRLPAGLDYATLHDHLKVAGFVIYAGQGGLSDSIFRISTMGDITREDLDRLLAVTAELLREGLRGTP